MPLLQYSSPKHEDTLPHNHSTHFILKLLQLFSGFLFSYFVIEEQDIVGMGKYAWCEECNISNSSYTPFGVLSSSSIPWKFVCLFHSSHCCGNFSVWSLIKFMCALADSPCPKELISHFPPLIFLVDTVKRSYKIYLVLT